jgi:hypothetical protein
MQSTRIAVQGNGQAACRQPRSVRRAGIRAPDRVLGRAGVLGLVCHPSDPQLAAGDRGAPGPAQVAHGRQRGNRHRAGRDVPAAVLHRAAGSTGQRHAGPRNIQPAGVHHLRDLEIPPVRHRPDHLSHARLRHRHRGARRAVRGPGTAGHPVADIPDPGSRGRIYAGGGGVVQSTAAPGAASGGLARIKQDD